MNLFGDFLFQCEHEESMVVIEVSAADKEFEDLCFEFGVELDDIVSVVSCFWVEFVNPGTSHAHHSVRVELVGSII